MAAAAPKIAVIGAGPVGCTLARILHLAGVTVTIYEGDSSPDFRSQGGTLDLHPNTGLAALKDAQLFDQFQEKARLQGDFYSMTDRRGKPYIQFGGGTGGPRRPEIDREDLRAMIMKSLPDGMIRWGYKLRMVESDGTLIFDGHDSASGFDLVVGCDGAWSKVRSFITPVTPYYSGLGYHGFSIPDAAENASELLRLINGGNLFAHSEGQMLAIQGLGNGSLQIGWSSRRPVDWMESCGYNPHDLEQSRAAVLAQMEDWSPSLRDALERAQGACSPRSLYMLPPDFQWEHRPGYTLIGDAAHVMTPYAGEGVNLGMDDARKLAAAIVAAIKAGGAAEKLDAQVKAYEKEMFPRMHRYQILTNEVMNRWMFSDNVDKAAPGALLCHVKFDMPSILHPLATAGMYSWWWTKTAFRW
jgi:2-polyprenyl-6-methoxyphenol hydroxylase-like FAD-dependent oxidoreductase